MSPAQFLNDRIATVTEDFSKSDRVIAINFVIFKILSITRALIALYVDVEGLQIFALRAFFLGLLVLTFKDDALDIRFRLLFVHNLKYMGNCAELCTTKIPTQ